MSRFSASLTVSLSLSMKNEGELFELILQSKQPEDREQRIEALIELASRRFRFQDRTACFYGIIATAGIFGMSSPEGQMLSELLTAILDTGPGYFDIFLSNLAKQGKNRFFVAFAARFIKNLNPSQKEKAIPTLASVLFQQDSLDLPAESISDTFTTMQDESLNRKATSEIVGQTTSANPIRVLLATRILSKIAGKEISKAMLLVLDRTFDKWYDSNNEQIQDQVIMYLTRCPTEEALPKLRQMILLRRTDLLAQVFRGFHFRSAAQMLQELAEQNFGNPTSTDIAVWCIMALAEMDPELVDIRRLASNNVFGSAYSRFYVKKLLLNAKERAKPILFELLKSPNSEKYEFAADCLSELGVTLDEMTMFVGESVTNALYKFFYPNEIPETIWQQRDTKSLGGPIGKGTKRFDFFLIEVLSSLNLQVLYVDSANKPGVDVVALSPSSNYMIVAGCTSGPLKNDIGNLTVTLEEMRGNLKAMMDRHKVLPVIFAASQLPITADEARSAKEAGIIILGRAEIEEVLRMSRTGRTSKDLIDLLKTKQHGLLMPP